MKTSLLRHRYARRHLIAIWVNSLGGGAFDIALPLIVLLTTDSIANMAFIAVAAQLPKAFPGFLIGGIVDRRSPKAMVLLGFWGQAITVLAVVLIMTNGISNVWWLVACAYLRGSFDMFARTATFVSTPIMYGDLTPKFNAAMSTAWTSAAIVGPALGGIISVTSSPVLLLAADGLSFVAIALVALWLPFPTKPTENASESESLFSSLRTGYARMIRLTGWWRFVVTVVAVGCVYSPLATVTLYFTSKELHEGPSVVGFVSAASAFGLFCGSLLAAALSELKPQQIMKRASLIMIAGSLLLFIPHWIAIATGVFVICTGGLAWAIARTTILHNSIPPKDLGKAMTAVQFLETAVGPISIVIATVLMEKFSSNAAFVYITVAAVTTLVFVLFGRDLLASSESEANDVQGSTKPV